MRTRFLFASLAVIAGLLCFQPIALSDELTADSAAPADPAAPPACPEKGPPLPFHTIEGYGGGAITPMAYLVNPAPAGCTFGEPSVAMSYVNLGRKNLDALTVTENLFGRIELGYAADRLGLGTLPSDLRGAGFDVDQSDVWLHTFSVRFLAVKENSCETQLPAVTFGVHFKYNSGIAEINSEVKNALGSIGYRNDSGEDFTLTLTKTLPHVLPRPLIVSGGMRISDAANLGFLGFGDTWHATFEGNVAYLITDWLALAYEFRGKADPYQEIPGLINGENNWQAFDAGFILNKHSTLVFGYGIFGTLANADANSAWWAQLKYEF